MPKIRAIDIKFLDEVFGMGGGYVLDFSDRTMGAFFRDELNIDIDDARYAVNGTSKAKRLRCFLQLVDAGSAVRVLEALWNYREASRAQFGTPETVHNAHGRLLALANQMMGHGPAPAAALFGQQPAQAYDHHTFPHLKGELMRLSGLAAQERGYAFEQYLTRLFNVFGLRGRDPFRLRGEQIDGSFDLDGETYLVEAKWQGAPTGAADLHVFHGKLEQKAIWTRGIFVSNSGFTTDGLHAFGRGKRIVCMDGLDLCDAFDRSLPLNHVIARKVRHAAETGEAFGRVRDLFL